jgi:hypothetical protein
MRKVAVLIAVLACMTLCVFSEAKALTIYTSSIYDGVLEIVQSGYYFNWLRDDDGDGIPNGDDETWTRPLDGTGYGTLESTTNTVDAKNTIVTPIL